MLVRTRDFIEVKDDAVVLAASNPIAMQLLANNVAPPGYELLATVRWRVGDEGKTAVFARLCTRSFRTGAPPQAV